MALKPILAAANFVLSSAANAENGHLQKMKSYTEVMRNLAYRGVIISTGNECYEVTHSFVRGADSEGTVYVTVRRRDGEDYLIMGKQPGAGVDGSNLPPGRCDHDEHGNSR